MRDIFDPGNGAVAEIERLYEARIARHGQRELESWPLATDFFEDGSRITAEARKIYRRHADLQRAFPNPFHSSEVDLTFQNWLRANRPGTIEGISLTLDRAWMSFRALFDEEYYRTKHPIVEVALERGDYPSALDHYIHVGSNLLLDPNELFLSGYYFDRAKYHEGHTLRQHPRSVESTLLWHYLTVGLPNGIEPLPTFDSASYLRSNPDVAAAYATGSVSCPLSHYLMSGAQEIRSTGGEFNATDFLNSSEEARTLVRDGRVRGAIGAFLKLSGMN